MKRRIHDTFLPLRRTARGLLAGLLVATLAPSALAADPVEVSIGISGWTGFAPLTLAKEEGIFERNGLDVTIRKIPQKDRHLAMASGAIECAATSVETWIVWNAAGIASRQVFKMDQGMGSDGIVARPGIDSVADLKGKTVAVSAPGTNPYFTLAWILDKNGLSMKDVRLATLEPGPAANALMSGAARLDAAVTYEPYLSAVLADPKAGKLIADSRQYPMVFDSFGCTSKFIDANPQAVQALTNSYFEALAMIAAQPDHAFEVMGADVKQTGAEFKESRSRLRWADLEQNREFFEGPLQTFNREAADLLLANGVIRKIPDLDALVDPSFLK